MRGRRRARELEGETDQERETEIERGKEEIESAVPRGVLGGSVQYSAAPDCAIVQVSKFLKSKKSCATT